MSVTPLKNTQSVSSYSLDLRETINSCVQIRQDGGDNSRYFGLLEQVFSSLSERMDSKRYVQLNKCLSVIVQGMPEKVRTDASICSLYDHISQDIYGRLEGFLEFSKQSPSLALRDLEQILAIYRGPPCIIECNRYSRMFDLVLTKLPKGSKDQENSLKDRVGEWNRAHYTFLRARLKEAAQSKDVDRILSKIDSLKEHFPKSLDLGLAKEIEACSLFAIKKLSILCFSERLRLEKRKIYPVLSIDGGGIRGIIPAIVLKEIEKRTGKAISELFKLVGGTSTGGMLALGLTKPHPDLSGRPEYRAEDLLRLYTEEHQQIFRDHPRYHDDTTQLSWIDKVGATIHNPKYQTPSLFQDKFKNTPVSEALTDVVVTANRFDSILTKTLAVGMSGFSAVAAFFVGAFGGRSSILSHESVSKDVQLFTRKGMKSLDYRLGDLEEEYGISYREKRSSSMRKSWNVTEGEGDFKMADVAKVTSAAPTFFPPIEYDNSLLMDGGVLQNNPTIPCILEAMDRKIRREDIFVVSLGTGVENRRSGSAKAVADVATSLFFETTQPQLREDLTAMGTVSAGAFHRLQHHFEGRAPDLDDTDPETIEQLIAAGEQLVQENNDYIEAVCNLLKSEL